MTLAPQQSSIIVRWSPPAEDGGRTDLYYQLEHSDPDNLGSYTDTVYVSGSTRSRTFSGLRPFTQYCVRVTAHNGVSDQDPDGTHLRRVEECTTTLASGELTLPLKLFNIYIILAMVCLFISSRGGDGSTGNLPICGVESSRAAKWSHHRLQTDIHQLWD